MDQQQKKYTLYTPAMNYVDPNPDLIIYNVFYHKELDTLFITYKNVKTNQQIMREIREPLVPVFITKKKMTKMESMVPISECTRHYVRYNPKYYTDEIKALLYDYKEVTYIDKYGVKQYKKIYDKVPKETFALNPNLYGYGETIEQLILKEFALQRFEFHDGYASEVVPAFKLDVGGFDIETIQEDNTTKININTFIDLKSKQAYAFYVKDYEKYPFQDTIQQDLDLFIKETRDKLLETINESNLQGSKSDVEEILNKCRNIAEALNFNIIECQSEEELIIRSIETMFEKHHPDVLLAFNTPYDLTHFQKRIEELGLPIGSLNMKKYKDVQPRFMERMDRRTWTMFGDTRSGKKRSCVFDVIRPTHIMDLQMLYYSNRSFNTFSSESLQNTAERELGFGKLDYSEWSNSVVQLPFKNFRVHLSYGIIDSILLLFLNEKLHDIESKIAYTIITKNNIEQTVHSNPSISNWVFCSMFNSGWINGVNMNKLIKRADTESLIRMKELTGVDFLAHRSNLPSRYLSQEETETSEEDYLDIDDNEDREYKDTNVRIRGGIVSPPQNLLAFISDLIKRYPILNNEVELSIFLKQLQVAYFDFKSHYPFTFIVRNLFMQCIKAEIVSLWHHSKKELIFSKNLRNNSKKKVDNFGFLHMPIINRDIITYSNKACFTPSMTEIIEKKMPLDSEPNFKVKEPNNLTLEIKNKVFDKLIQLLVQLDRSSFSDTEENFFPSSNATFLLNNGSFKYYGGRIDYIYNSRDLASEMIFEETIDKADFNERLIFSRDKGMLKNNPELTKHPVKEINETDFGPWIRIDDNLIDRISKIDFTSEPIILTQSDFTIFATANVFYFPFKYYLNTLREAVNPDKAPLVSPWLFRFKIKQETIKIQMKYNIKFKGVDLDIVQTFDTLNIHLNYDDYYNKGVCTELTA